MLNWTFVALACGVVLLVEAGVVSLLVRRAGIAFWRRKLVMFPLIGGLLALLAAGRLLAAYGVDSSNPYLQSTDLADWSALSALGAITLAGTLLLLMGVLLGILIERE